MQNTYLLQSTVLTGGQDTATENTTAEVQQPTDSGDTTATGGTMGGFTIILLYAAIIGAMYFFTIRPARKREQLIQAKQEEIRLGDNVITTSGMHGKVVDIGTETFNIEFGTNKGVIIPVSKKDVLPVGVDLNAKPSKAAKADATDK